MAAANQTSLSLAEKKKRAAEILLRRRAAAVANQTIPLRDRGVPAPLSYAQQRLWFLDKLVPGSPFYNMPAAIRLAAPLDPPVAAKTLQEIVRRHEALRTTFTESAGQPRQSVEARVEAPLAVHDLRALAPAESEAETLRLVEEEARRPFDLRNGPLLRAALYQLGGGAQIFQVNLHHIVADGWSIGVLIEEFQRLYSAFSRGEPSPLRPVAIQYADFAAWQRERVESGALQPQLQFWMEKLADLPTLELPADYPRRAVQGFDGETLLVTLPADLSDRLKEFSRRQGVTLFVTLLAAFNCLLHRYSGQDEIVIGEPVANRNRLELEPLIGFFVNSLVLRTDLSGDPSFLELLRRSRDVVLEADANQDVPFEVLVERLQPERTMGRNPLFQVSLQFFTGAEAGGRHATVSSDSVEIEKGTASLDLAFDLLDSDQGILIRAEYSTELFRRETVARMAGHYRNLLAAFVEDPHLRVSQAPLMTPDEAAAVLAAGATQYAPPPFVPVTDLVARQTRETPAALAVEDSSRRLTYAGLDDLTNRLAGLLRSRGAGPEQIVALCVDRSIESIAAVLAVWRTGAAYLPLEPSLPADRVELLLSDAKPALLLTARRHADRFAQAAFPVVCVEDAGTAPADIAFETVGAENLAYVIYTSGSAGIPKGVMVEHGAIGRHLQWMQSEFPLNPRDRSLFKYSYSFDAALLEMLQPLIAGASIVVVDEDRPAEVDRLAALMARHGITVIDAVPAMVDALLDQPLFRRLDSLRRIVCGGESLPPALVRRIRDHFEDVELINMYGPTETTISATFWRCPRSAAVDALERVPIGRPAAPYAAWVLDQYLNPLPAGVPGELCIGGYCLARGYLGHSELTRTRFVPDPFSPASVADALLYRTGDRCRLLAEGGGFEFLGRLDDQAKIRGYRIEPGEVASVLAASPQVRACAVVASPSASQGDSQLVAYVVPNSSAPEFWPSVGEYFLYDELLYHVMTSDRVRTSAYAAAIERSVRGKVVADLGTGADLALARLCVERGARKVYAIEMLDEAFAKAQQLVHDEGLSGRIVLIHGDARRVQLPEPVDVCVSELIGTIGSSEGVIEVLNDARRLLSPKGEMVPYRCLTRLAAVSLPGNLRAQPSMTEIPRFYTGKLFAREGRRFDVRLCVKNLPAASLISESAVIEDLRFDSPIAPEEFVDFRLTVRQRARLDGFLLWVVLHPGRDQVIDVLRSDCSWLPVFLPVFPEGLLAEPGDTISGTWARLPVGHAMTPDYLVRGVVKRQGKSIAEFSFESRRDETAYCGNAFYEALFSAASPNGDLAAANRVQDWKHIYDELYRPGPTTDDRRDAEFDIVGWNSSFTGEPLPQAALREQVDSTVARIAALGGSRLLEIGCGTGLLLLPLAERYTQYTATDFSAPALDQLRRIVAGRGWSHVSLLERPADQFDGLAPGSFDVIVLNSVIQYFPGIEYLVTVLDGARRLLRPGGHLFIGDVRSLPLLPHFQAQLAAHHRTHAEQELVIDPEFFAAYARREGKSNRLAIELKRGRHHNELTAYRYDAILQFEGPAAEGMPAWTEVPWSGLGSLVALRQLLESSEGVLLLRVTGIPNARLVDGGQEPEDLWDLAGEAGRYRVQVTWPAAGAPTHCDLLCASIDIAGVAPPQPVLWPAAVLDPGSTRPWSSYANHPATAPANGTAGSSAEAERQLTHTLRAFLRRWLPDYMLPSAFVLMDALPVTASGKLNRRALPSPNPDGIASGGAAFAAPVTALHETILGIWREVLGLEAIGIDSSFFHIGGHSLLATQVATRLSDAIGMEVPLRLLFEHPSIRALAETLEEMRLRGGNEPSLAPIRRAAQSRDDAMPRIDVERLSDEEVEALLHGLISQGGAS